MKVWKYEPFGALLALALFCGGAPATNGQSTAAKEGPKKVKDEGKSQDMELSGVWYLSESGIMNPDVGVRFDPDGENFLITISLGVSYQRFKRCRVISKEIDRVSLECAGKARRFSFEIVAHDLIKSVASPEQRLPVDPNEPNVEQPTAPIFSFGTEFSKADPESGALSDISIKSIFSKAPD